MWFGQILRNQVSRPFVHMLFLSNNLNSSATARCSRFHDVHIFEPFHFAFVYPPLVVFREYVCGRCNIIVLAVCPLHFEHIPP